MTIYKNKYRGTITYSKVYSELITAAKYRGTVTYQEIAMMMGLPLTGNLMGRETGQILGEISEYEVSNGRPMLSAIAVGVSGHPGDRFFAFAKDLGKMKPEEDKRKFWQKECQAVYEVWKTEIKG
jgi:hypothetical protein